MKATFVLLLSLATAYGATHVNISIAQQPATNPADVTYIDGKASAELKAGPSNEERSAQLRVANNDANFKYDMQKMNNDGMNNGFSSDGRSARVEVAGNKNQMPDRGGNMQFYHSSQSSDMKDGARPQQARGYGRMSQRQRQFSSRPHNSQEKQNQEFERYIQSYHSGPTVETVFETSNPAPQRYQQSPSSFSSAASSRPARIQTFERQVALPVEATKQLLPAADAEHQTHTVVNSQPKPITEVPKESQETKTPLNANPQPAYEPKIVTNNNNYDQTNYNLPNSYDRVNYDQPNFGYDQGHDSDFNNQYLPPSVDEPQGGYNDYYGPGNEQSGFYGSSHNDFYPQQPTYQQRPVVTKTIQIAQPALKAKKFEVRHPAIQKEFYDIEERVLIKPAGTVVVELDHPVAKIPRGETVLPLGHLHPAVAGAYGKNDGGVIQHQISSSGSYDGGHDENDNSGYNNQQYNPSPAFNVKPQRDSSTTTLGSSITATPTNDQHTKDATVEANLNRQFTGDAHLVATTESSFDDTKPRQNLEQDRYYIATDPYGNQRKVQSKQLSPKMFKSEESDTRYPTRVEVSNNGAPSASSSFNQQANNDRQFFYPSNEQQQGSSFSADSGDGNFKSQQNTNGQLNSDNRENEDQFEGEYLSDDFYNKPQDLKPARLRELPAQESSGTQTHIIKHEHNINIPPAQHNIYLGRLEQSPNQYQQKSAQYGERPAQVSEIRPYLQRYNGPVVVYAATKVRPSGRYSDAEAQRFVEPSRSRVQIDHQRSQLRNENEGTNNRVQYSAPYSNMRYHPEQSARLTYGNYYANENKDNFRNSNPNKENLKLEENASDNKPLNEDAHKTQIQIQIPHLPQEADKPIVISSTISPPVHSERIGKYRTPLRAMSNAYEQPSKEQLELASPYNDDRRSANLKVLKPDCDQPMKQSARYETAPTNVNQQQQQQQTFNHRGDQQRFSRIVEVNNANEMKDNSAPAPPITKVQANNIDVSLKSSAGHVATPGSRVIAATPAPTGASASSESFHKRRIVVNHPFQTVREVVEHEPITNYHQIQVNEPASPALYRLPYTQTHGALRQVHTVGMPVVYHHSAASTHGNLQYAVPYN